MNTKAKSKDVILFVNKDTVTGSLKSIKNNKVLFETPFATLTIPTNRIASIVLGEDGWEKPRRNSEDVQLFFANGGGRITRKMGKVEKSKIFGSSENFGDGQLDIRAFEKVIFNIYSDKKKSTEDDDDVW